MVELPNQDTYVRIENKRSGKVLADGEELYHTDKEPLKAEHWWRIIPVEGQSSRYIIKNVTTGRVIWCRNKDRRAGAIDSGGKWADNWFIFEETKAPNSAGTFRIRCPATNCVLVSRTERKPEVDGFELRGDGSPDYEDHHFQFSFEDMNVEKVEYDLRAAKHSGVKPSAIAQQDLENETSVKQTQTFVYNEDKTEEHTFEHSHGFDVSIGQKFTVGSWPIWTGETEVKVGTSNQWKWGEKNVVTTKWGINQALEVPANSSFVATLTATKMELTVPFKMTWVAKDSGAKNITHGVYKGVAYYNVSTSVEPKTSAAENMSLEDAGKGDATMLRSSGGAGEPPYQVQRPYQEENKQAGSYEPYGNEKAYNGAQSYDGQGSYEEGQRYDNGAEQEEEDRVEPGYGENRPYEDGYDGRQFYKANYEENGSYLQRYKDGESYNIGYQQNGPQEADDKERQSYEPYGQRRSDETDAQRNDSYYECKSYEPSSKQPTQQSTYGQSSYENGNSYEERQSYKPEVENQFSGSAYQGNAGSYSGDYDEQPSYTSRYESKQFNDASTEERSYNSKYQDTNRSREDDSFNEQRYVYGENNNTYDRINNYDQPSKPSYQDNTESLYNTYQPSYSQPTTQDSYSTTSAAEDAYGMNGQYGWYEDTQAEPSYGGQGQRYDIPFRSYGNSSGER